MPLIDVRQRGVVQPDVLVVVHSRYLTGSLTGSLAGMLSASSAALTNAPCKRQINAAVIGAIAMLKMKHIDRTLFVSGSS
jgi:acyl-CoA synthetase (NDP forming)